MAWHFLFAARLIADTSSCLTLNLLFQQHVPVSDACSSSLPFPCLNSGYQDPNDCARCRCPDGWTGDDCGQLAGPVNGASRVPRPDRGVATRLRVRVALGAGQGEGRGQGGPRDPLRPSQSDTRNSGKGQTEVALGIESWIRPCHSQSGVRAVHQDHVVTLLPLCCSSVRGRDPRVGRLPRDHVAWIRARLL